LRIAYLYLVMKDSTASMVICIVISFLVFVSPARSRARQQVPPAIFMFGDGALDVGNNNYLESRMWRDPIRANHSYYGIDFLNSEAMGRFSNGYNIADFIAMAMGFEMSPPAYLSPSPIKDFTGVNYASEGLHRSQLCFRRSWNLEHHCRFITHDSCPLKLMITMLFMLGAWASNTLYLASPLEVTIHLLEQVDNFANTTVQLMSELGKHELRKLLSKSLFVVSIGTIDLLRIFTFVSYGRESKEDGHADVQILIATYEVAITAMYNMGARKFGIINIPPIGCTPGGMQMFHPRPGGCDESLNKFATEFNNGLEPLMARLTSKFDGLRYSIADFYGFSNATFMNPSAAGMYIKALSIHWA
ncbi:hypothetical protein EJB05_47125, partial [Eragrostis curvula]